MAYLVSGTESSNSFRSASQSYNVVDPPEK